MKLLDWLLDLLYPPKCMLCRKLLDSGRQTVCPACLDSLPDYDGAEPAVRFSQRCIATFFYREPLRGAILRYKFSGCRAYAAQFGQWMAVTARDKLAGEYDMISWVPVSRKRRRTRGYDQAELLCRAAADALGCTAVRTLTKTDDNPPQSTLADASMRAANVRGVYQAYRPEDFAGRRILLIDDIVTTGSTLSECCRVLLTAGASGIVCAALAAPERDPQKKGEHE